MGFSPCGISTILLELPVLGSRTTSEIFAKKGVAGGLGGVYTLVVNARGRSSGVERHVANVNVVSSNLIARCKELILRTGTCKRMSAFRNPYSIGELPARW
jgi:hypothetical protein